ncbi:MAG: helix-turn-helix transcriptional regulator [Dehalococcoidia bacterium]|nr:helix-turn-helix transcriptional regulator [Dehalococcoidia bacterium]
MQTDRLKGNLELLLLSALTMGPAHGYGLIRRLREMSEGFFDLPEGTVYPALHRLEREGLVSSSWTDEPGRPRKSYRLTPVGERQLAVERVAWQRFGTAVGAVMRGTS